MCADNADVKEIAKMESLIDNATVKLSELRSLRDELKVKLEQLENEEYLTEEDDERLMLQQDDVKHVDGAE